MRVLLNNPVAPPEQAVGDRPIDFHRRLPSYEVTALVNAPDLARRLGVARVVVKNETSRFGLPSFKVLGASWATYAALRDRLGPLPDGPLTVEVMRAWAAPAKNLTLLAATDGNHGRAVARVAGWFGLQARIYIPDFVLGPRRRAIESEGAELVVVDGPYDAAVDAALEASSAPNQLLISDTARAATDVVPKLVTAGYTTAYAEVEEQLRADDRIDAVFVQAGVGGLASATTSWARVTRAGRSPRVAVVEPEGAACIMAAVASGEPKTVSATAVTAMAVLQCGTVSLTAFPNLQAGVSCCLAIEDHWAVEAVDAMRASGVLTGSSGAAGLAGLMAAFGGPFAAPVRQHLGIDGSSRLLVVATESPAAGGSE
jgi:diaminopropionate ammonia-lyase